MATIHNVLASVTAEGVAKLVYAHPIIQKTSTILNNRKVITLPRGTVVRLVIKMMPSGKRILLSCRDGSHFKSIQDFINEVTEETMCKASTRESDSGYPIITKFDGEQDATYLLTSRVLPRFSGDETASETEDEEQSDGFVRFGNLYVPEIVVRTLKAVSSIAKSERAANLLLVGSSGNGKTSLAMQFANENHLSFVKVNCSTVRDPEEWFGYREAVDGSTVFIETDFTKSVKAGNTVILLDEVNRLEPYLHNSLMPLLDETRSTQIHGVDITCGDNVIFFCTMNIGSGFVGTFLLDNALKNRMDATLVMTKLSPEREIALLVERTGTSTDVATKIISYMERIRETVAKNEMDIDVSHRSALKVARMVKTAFMDIKEALTFVIFNNAENVEQSKMLVDSLIGG